MRRGKEGKVHLPCKKFITASLIADPGIFVSGGGGGGGVSNLPKKK